MHWDMGYKWSESFLAGDNGLQTADFEYLVFQNRRRNIQGTSSMYTDMDGLQKLHDPKLQLLALQRYKQLAVDMWVPLMIDKGYKIFHLRPEHDCDYEFGHKVGCSNMLSGELRGCIGLIKEIIEICCFDQDRLIPLEFFGITDTDPGEFDFWNPVVAEWQYNDENYIIPADLLVTDNTGYPDFTQQ